MERKKERRIGTRIEIHIYTNYIVNKYVQKHMLASMRTYILRMYGWMDGWTDGWIDGCINMQIHFICKSETADMYIPCRQAQDQAQAEAHTIPDPRNPCHALPLHSITVPVDYST